MDNEQVFGRATTALPLKQRTTMKQIQKYQQGGQPGFIVKDPVGYKSQPGFEHRRYLNFYTIT